MRLRLLAEAKLEIGSARKYLNGKVPNLGDRFLDDLEETFAVALARALEFPNVETLPADTCYRRAKLKIFRYIVVFDVVDDEVIVVAIAHTSHAPNYWLRRR